MTRTCQILTVLALVAAAAPALGSPTPITAQDASDCDTLSFPAAIGDELGTLGFPADEMIGAGNAPTGVDGCPVNDSAGIPNVAVIITNITGIPFTDMHYVADPTTTFSNFDGFINGQRAMRIDSLGSNTPLKIESMTADNIFEPAEVWTFIIDDWASSTGGTPSDFASIGVPSITTPSLSTGSIVGIPVPEPATGALAAAALLIASGTNRRHH